MFDTPKSMRLHIGLFGRRNVGKSSLTNSMLGFPLSIVSDVAGTTTDPVEKAMEIFPLGPVVFVDTAGIDDVGDLGALRTRKTLDVVERVDMAIVVCDHTGIGPYERELIVRLAGQKTPTVCVFNKCDIAEPNIEEARALLGASGEAVRVSAATGRNIDAVRESLIRLAPDERLSDPPLVRDLIAPGDSVLLVVPIDLAAPKGRLILPQVQAIREILDADGLCTVVKERDLTPALKVTKSPALVICDSQVVLQTVAETPLEIPLTTLSIQCGACMVTRKHMLSWLFRAERQKVPMTNYGVAISLMQGVLQRSLQPFPAAFHAYEAARERGTCELA